MAQILDGKACARAARQRIREEVRGLATAVGYPPHVVFVQVGSIPASTTYVSAKSAAAQKAGMLSTIERLPDDSVQDDLLALIAQLNANPLVHGILVQLPLPAHIDPLVVATSIDPRKDVDCFHPENVGRLTIGLPGPRPATPQGILMLLDHYGIDVRGMEAVVVGRSNLVGKPMGLMLLALHSTVSWCHSQTPDFSAHVRHADLLVAAAGQAGLIRGSMVKPGAVVVDVGTNYVAAGSGAGPTQASRQPAAATVPIRGQRDTQEGIDPGEIQAELQLVGDVAFDEVEPIAGWISPVPGGVGPMTIASVLQNGLMLYKLAVGAS